MGEPTVSSETVTAPSPGRQPTGDENASLRKRLLSERVEAIATIITFVAMIAGWLSEGQLPPVWTTVFYVIAYIAGGIFGLQAGLESLRELRIDVDLLMILAAAGAAIVGAPLEGAVLLFLFSLSNVLQNYALDRTRNAIHALIALRPEEALVRRGDELVTLPLEAIALGDTMVVRPGERLALDGMVISGESSVDQSAITGESIPVAKEPGDTVLAGTINERGSIEVEVTHLAEDTTLAKLVKLVEEAHSEKAQTQRFIERAEQYYALGVIVMTIGAILVPISVLGEAFQPAFYRAMTLMVAASPCALVISTPATVLSAIANGARRGVLFKGGVYVERAAEIKVVAFDKTGTLTYGQPRVTDVRVCDQDWRGDEAQLLTLAAAVESRSEHPLAEAVIAAAQKRGLSWPDIDGFQSETGKGVQARVEERQIAVGNPRYFAGYRSNGYPKASQVVEELEAEGKTSIMVAELNGDGTAHMLGVLGIADVLRPDSTDVIRRLKSLGVKHVMMLTGDSEGVARAIAGEAGLDDFHAGLLPEDKLRLLKEASARFGPVAMVGDGVNDAPALAAADIGIAMGAAGTDVALETADIVLMADDLAQLPYVIGLSRKTRRTLIQNLAFALLVIAGLVGAVLGVGLTLPLSVVGHEGSTVLVSLNGLRLLGYNWPRK
ncbi:MAG: heavy metal translocating P-type ATPase [Chloroflexota bacterium]